MSFVSGRRCSAVRCFAARPNHLVVTHPDHTIGSVPVRPGGLERLLSLSLRVVPPDPCPAPRRLGLFNLVHAGAVLRWAAARPPVRPSVVPSPVSACCLAYLRRVRGTRRRTAQRACFEGAVRCAPTPVLGLSVADWVALYNLMSYRASLWLFDAVFDSLRVWVM